MQKKNMRFNWFLLTIIPLNALGFYKERNYTLTGLISITTLALAAEDEVLYNQKCNKTLLRYKKVVKFFSHASFVLLVSYSIYNAYKSLKALKFVNTI